MNCSPEVQAQEEVVHCHECNRELDLVNSAISGLPEDSIYICFGTIKQKIFVYGKYTGTKYGAITLTGQYTKQQCADKVCDEEIVRHLEGRGETEYSRLVNCHRGGMDCIILTKEMVEKRKRDLAGGALSRVFPAFNDKRKYFCRHDAERLGFACQCGEELIELNSDRYRELMGMDDRQFVADYLPGLLDLR
ncbi:MAG: hypothetical protein KBA61_03930 [Spirochaetes bacterium]|nr:hypothetical protein [Spirochaetota bacterium]HPA72748.1 hypothetical protein [Spirochaetota bacterium]